MASAFVPLALSSAIISLATISLWFSVLEVIFPTLKPAFFISTCVSLCISACFCCASLNCAEPSLEIANACATVTNFSSPSTVTLTR